MSVSETVFSCMALPPLLNFATIAGTQLASFRSIHCFLQSGISYGTGTTETAFYCLLTFGKKKQCFQKHDF